MKPFVAALSLQALFLAAASSAEVREAPWMLSLRAALPRAKELGFGGGYDVGGGRIHVPVTPLMADAFDAAPHPEVIAFLQRLTADEAYQPQKEYISTCIRALKEDEKPTWSRLKDADGHEVAVVYYHVPMLSMPLKKKAPNMVPEPPSGLVPSRRSS